MDKLKNWLPYKLVGECLYWYERRLNTYTQIFTDLFVWMWGWEKKESLFAVLRIVYHDHFWDKRLGINTARYYFVHERRLIKHVRRLRSESWHYTPTPYYRLQAVFDYLHLTQDDVFVDVGCGMGRALFFAAFKRVKKVIGIEIDADVVALARRNVRSYKSTGTPIELVEGDAARYPFEEGTVIFYSNPFKASIFEETMGKIKESLTRKPRKIRIVANSVEFDAILQTHAWLELEKRMPETRFSLWKSR